MVDYIEIPTQARLISIPPYIGKIEGQLICLSNNPEKFNNKKFSVVHKNYILPKRKLITLL